MRAPPAEGSAYAGAEWDEERLLIEEPRLKEAA
jgi:hypothetical protein